jgi:hypothetical protein
MAIVGIQPGVEPVFKSEGTNSLVLNSFYRQAATDVKCEYALNAAIELSRALQTEITKSWRQSGFSLNRGEESDPSVAKAIAPFNPGLCGYFMHVINWPFVWFLLFQTQPRARLTIRSPQFHPQPLRFGSLQNFVVGWQNRLLTVV